MEPDHRPAGAVFLVAVDVDVELGVADADLYNDGDGLADWPNDPACQYAAWTRGDARCQDGIDNDGATGIDFDGGASVNGGVPLDVADPQCSGKPWRNSESANACGLGAEIVSTLAALATLRRRAR